MQQLELPLQIAYPGNIGNELALQIEFCLAVHRLGCTTIRVGLRDGCFDRIVLQQRHRDHRA